MVNHHSAKAFIRLREHRLKAKLNSLYASRIDATSARSFSDDADFQSSTVQMSPSRSRLGMRDDEINCSFANIVTVL